MRAIETTARHSLQLANSSQLKCGAIRGGRGGGLVEVLVCHAQDELRIHNQSSLRSRIIFIRACALPIFANQNRKCDPAKS